MSTWLDFYIDGALEGLRARAQLIPGLETVLEGLHSDLEAMRWMALTSTQTIREGQVGEGAARQLLMTVILPWLLPRETTATAAAGVLRAPVAYQLSEDLVSALVQGEPPASADVSATLEAHNLYLDLAGGGLPLTDQQAIQAIFVQPTSHPGQWVCVTILTTGRSKAITGRYVWTFRADGRALEHYGADAEDTAPERVVSVVWRLLRLAILYAASQAVSDPQPPEWLPRRDDHALSQLDTKKRRARRKKATVFQVRALARRRSDSLPTGLRAGWTLDHIVDVRGHFRWVPVGPRALEQRRLQWIEGYARGTGERKPILQTLETARDG